MARRPGSARPPLAALAGPGGVAYQPWDAPGGTDRGDGGLHGQRPLRRGLPARPPAPGPEPAHRRAASPGSTASTCSTGPRSTRWRSASGPGRTGESRSCSGGSSGRRSSSGGARSARSRSPSRSSTRRSWPGCSRRGSGAGRPCGPARWRRRGRRPAWSSTRPGSSPWAPPSTRSPASSRRRSTCSPPRSGAGPGPTSSTRPQEGDGSPLEEGATLRWRVLDEAISACESGEIEDAKSELAFRRLHHRLGR